MLARADEVFASDVEHLQRPFSHAILDQVWITTSGIFTEPHAPNAKGRAFLERVALSPADMERLCWRNAAVLLGLGA